VGCFDVISRLGVGRFALIGWAEKWGFGVGRCFALIGRSEKGRGRWWGCFAVIGRAEKWRVLAVTSVGRWWVRQSVILSTEEHIVATWIVGNDLSIGRSQDHPSSDF